MRDTFIFYGSWADSIETLPRTQQLTMYKAIVNYAQRGIETELSGGAKAIFGLIKPLIDANNKRYKNGCTGGRPKDDDAPRQELPGIELTNLTEPQYKKLCEKYGEMLTDKAIELFENWLQIGNKTAKQYIGKNHYAHFKADHWTIKEAEKALKTTGTNWSI